MSEPRHRVVIIGGGFGGLYAAQRLRKAPVDVTLLDRRNHHLFQPLLYQVAMGALSPANIASPLRAVLRRQANARVLLFDVTDIDVAGRRVLGSSEAIPYDTLIVATGARDQYFGHDGWAPYAPGLKSIGEAIDIRSRVLLAFEEAEREVAVHRQAALLTFIVVGAGPTGVELAGSLAELAHHTLRNNFRNIDPATAKILLVEGGDKILGTFPDPLPAKARAQLERMGVTVRTGAMVTNIERHAVTLKSGDQTEFVPATTVLWAAGVRASGLGAVLAEKAGAALDRSGRVIVQPDLTIPGHPEIFVVGDLANFTHQTGKPLPGVAQVAIQGGQYTAMVIQARLEGQTLPPFKYKDKGSMATIGRAAAVADLGWVRLSGYPAWMAWLLIHILFLIEHENRWLVMIQWAWSYVTRNRSARLIADNVGDVHHRGAVPVEEDTKASVSVGGGGDR
jgi:NADH dehydrogenase